jgi:predicted TIM-barrel fold metal-dependent hydrolase
MDYKQKFSEKVNLSELTNNPFDRISSPVSNALNSGSYCIDVHTHLFDIKCINKSFFIIRMLKDFVGLKSADESYSSFSLEDAYQSISQNEDNWEQELQEQLENAPINLSGENTKGVIDVLKAVKFLGFRKMEEVYADYIKNYALNKIVGGNNVIITALMMDLETGWNVSLKKTFYEQVQELKKLSNSKPILPFLACDPRRADLNSEKENLYSLFNLAFSKNENSFFGIKIYPALGYDPSDYRLWPIYEVCEKFNIPVLSHCGGETISTDELDSLVIYEGDKKVTLTGKNRKEIAYTLNDPSRWSLVLNKFPKLKLNFAHFGGYETWGKPSLVTHEGQKRKETIFEFMTNHDNVYADFSYNLVEIALSKNLREVITSKENIRKRTLFGTDYWVVNKEGDLLKEQREFLANMDKNADNIILSRDLTIHNAYNYLFK